MGGSQAHIQEASHTPAATPKPPPGHYPSIPEGHMINPRYRGPPEDYDPAFGSKMKKLREQGLLPPRSNNRQQQQQPQYPTTTTAIPTTTTAIPTTTTSVPTTTTTSVPTTTSVLPTTATTVSTTTTTTEQHATGPLQPPHATGHDEAVHGQDSNKQYREPGPSTSPTSSSSTNKTTTTMATSLPTTATATPTTSTVPGKLGSRQLNRPHSDDIHNNNQQRPTQPSTDNQPIDHTTTNNLAPIQRQESKDSVHATLKVTAPPTSLHTDQGEQNVLSVTMVNGNIDLCFKDSNIPTLVDTGATISCMREGLASTLSKLVPAEFIRIRARVYLADGAMCHITKSIKIRFKIQNKTFHHQFALLPNLTTPIVLGTDFLSKTRSTIQYSVDPTPKSQPIRAVRGITIPPFSEKAITGQVTCMNSVSQINGVTDNLDRDNKFSQYLVQRSVVTPNDRDRHPLILMNITSRPCRIRKGEIIAVFTKTEINSGSIHTQYDEPTLTPDNDLPLNNDSDNESTTDSDDTFYVPTPDYSIYSDSESDDPMTDDEYMINQMTEEIPTKDKPTYEKPTCLTDEQYTKFCNLIDEFDDIFVGKDNKIGCTHLYTHKIELIPDAKPMQFYPFRMAPHKAELLEAECEKLVKQDILEETNTGPWASRSFLVEKKGGQGYRLVTDLRYVNSQTINQALISPRADDSLEMIGEMRPVIFSKMDAQQGYFQIPIREEDRDKVAFLTRTKKYRYKAMPMGLATSAQAFQAVVNLILQNLQYKCAIPYLDDILCLSPSIDQHFIDLRDIFNALRNGKLKLKKTKCEFFLEELDFLGMKVTTEGIKPSPDKVDKIQSFPTPKNTKDVRSFTGLAQFYRKFIKGFSETARPLFDLLKHNKAFKWTDDCAKAFQTLKDAISNDVVLLYPDYQKEFHLTTDASGTALGATLSQEKDGELRPVAFGGRSLHDHERNYGATQREMLGVVFAVEYFRHYLEGRHFQLYTDHQALIHMLTKSENKNMWARWALKIQQFQFTIRHLKGKLNIPSDAMSRRDYPHEETPMTDPPPKPKAIKVQHRVMFNDTTNSKTSTQKTHPMHYSNYYLDHYSRHSQPTISIALAQTNRHKTNHRTN